MSHCRSRASWAVRSRKNRIGRILASMVIWLSLVALAAPLARAKAVRSACNRRCMSRIVDKVVKSMVAHDPYILPLAPVYEATENSHPAALGMMELWRTVTKAGTKTGRPNFLAIDPVTGEAFFLMQVHEAGDLSVAWGRIKVVHRKITQLELFVNRSRGDHGFSFSAKDLPVNVHSWMHPPANRVRATRAQLERLGQAAFDSSDHLKVKIARDCQFLEVGWHVIDPGLPGFGPRRADPDKPLGCGWPPDRPTDLKARTIVIDQKFGVVVDAAIVRGHVYPYPYFGHMMSAFIPDDMKQAQKRQDRWYRQMMREGEGPLLKPGAATGVVMQVLQFYDGRLQGLQINVHLEGPGARSVWLPR